MLAAVIPEIAWPWRGCPEHAEHAGASEAVLQRVQQIDRGLNLIEWAIRRSADSVNALRAVNELSALACYTRAFRALRAATVLAMEGLYLEARVYLRDVYESAGLGRVLAMKPEKAEAWLISERWVKDNEVRQFIESLVMPGQSASNSPYREYYRQAGDLHHPTARACLPLVLNEPDGMCEPILESIFDADTIDAVLREIALESTFVCFTIITAAADPDAINPDWRRDVHELATELSGEINLTHLERDWETERARFEDFQRHVLTGRDMNAALHTDPNSVHNVRRRQWQDSGEAGA